MEYIYSSVDLYEVRTLNDEGVELLRKRYLARNKVDAERQFRREFHDSINKLDRIQVYLKNEDYD